MKSKSPDSHESVETIKIGSDTVSVLSNGTGVPTAPPSVDPRAQSAVEAMIDWWTKEGDGVIAITGDQAISRAAIDAFLYELLRRKPQNAKLRGMVRPDTLVALDASAVRELAIPPWAQSAIDAASPSRLTLFVARDHPEKNSGPMRDILEISSEIMRAKRQGVVAIVAASEPMATYLRSQSTPPGRYEEATVDQQAGTNSPESATRLFEMPTFVARFGVPSDGLMAVLERAMRLSRRRPPEYRYISPRVLLLAFLELGRHSKLQDSTHWMWEVLTSRQRRAFDVAYAENFPQATDTASIAELVGQVSTTAESAGRQILERLFTSVVAIRRSVSKTDERLRLRHLLGALLTADKLSAAGRLEPLAELEIQPAEMRDRLMQDLPSWNTGDNLEEWARVLEVGSSSAKRTPSRKRSAGPTPAPTPNPEAPIDGIAKFAPDSVDGTDWIDIKREVTVLARYLAARELEPPIAVGVFGDWGSGKSFFMRKLRDRIDSIATTSRRLDKDGRACPYYGGIAQVEFNAWHYGEGNLWASLVAHLFEQLKPPDPASDWANRKETLLSAVDKAGGGVLAAEKQVATAEQKTREAQRALDAAVAAHAVAESRLKVATVLDPAREVLDDPKVRAEIDAATRALRDAGLAEAMDLGSGLASAKSLTSRAWAALSDLWSAIREPGRRARGWRHAAFVVLLPVALFWFLNLLPGWISEWKALGLPLGLFGSIGALVGSVTRRIKGPIETLERIRTKADELQKSEPAEVATLREARADALREENAQRAVLGSARSELTKAEEALKAIAPERRLREFIDGRVESDDYRKALGTLALVRRDFKTLADLLAQRRNGAEAAGNEFGIDRIVLYIDDLDRCSPEKVVEVLQAVHLLLAFEVFVVVVGVDARWVSRALHKQYGWLKESDDAVARGVGKERSATTLDYLEKIFQIPLWLRPFGKDEQVALVKGLTAPVEIAPTPPSAPLPAPVPPPSDRIAAAGSPDQAPAPARTPDRATASGANADSSRALEGTAAPTPAPPPEPPAVREDAPPPPPPPPDPEFFVSLVELSDDERRQLEALAPIYAKSPRAVKRYINSYRLLRAMLPEPETSSLFSAGDGVSLGVAITELLAILVGHATLGLDVLDAVLRSSMNGNATSMVDALAFPAQSTATTEWASLRERLRAAHAMEAPPTALATYQRAARRVGRFAFRTRPSGGAPASRARAGGS